jgi:hypothetical protein
MWARFDELRETMAPLQDWSRLADDLEGAVRSLWAQQRRVDEHATLEALQDYVRAVIEWMRGEVTRDFPAIRDRAHACESA